MAILNHGSTIRTADGGQSTTTIVTASNIGTYGVTANSTYYIGTTQNVFNRASGAQTLTGVSIDGNAANITAYTINQNVGTANAPSFAGATLTSTLSITGGDGLRAFRAGAATVTSHLYWANTTNTVAYNWQLDENNNAAMWGYTSAWGKLLTVTSAGAFSASGDVRAPIFYDSNNTSYYLDAANSGTSLLVAGNVGIGTTSPVSKLHVVGEGDTVTLQKSNNVPALAFLGTSTNKSVIEGGDNFNFYTGGSSRFYIKNDGNVGIGTTSPSQKLHVVGTGFASTDFRAPIFYDSNNTAYYLDPANSGTSLLVAGNVGIGTTSPSYKLHVEGTSNFTDFAYIRKDLALPVSTSTAYGQFSANPAAGPQSYLELIESLSNAIGVNDPLRFRSVTSPEKFSSGSWSADASPPTYANLFDGNAISNVSVITAADYAGGITAKRFVVDLSAAYRRPNFITIQSDYGNNNFWAYSVLIEKSVDNVTFTTACSTITLSNNSARLLAFSLGDLFDNRYLRFTFTSTQAITTGGALIINRIRSYGNQNYSSSIPVYTNSSGNLFSTTSTYLATSSGNVGIGTSSPSQKLHVVGTGFASADFRAPIFYDSGNTAYYLDPASTSNLVGLTVANTITGSVSGNAATATNVAWTGITQATRTNYDLIFQPPNSGYAGFTFNTTGGVQGSAGYLLIRGTSDNDVYTAEGITLVADAGWLTLAQRTTASKGVRIMTGTTSSERFKITTAGDVQIVNGNTFTYNSNVVLHAANYGGYSTFSGSVTSTYGNFTTPGLIMGDAQYGFYVVSGNVYYKSASGGVHYWRNIANSANTMSLDNSGILTVSGNLSAPIFYDSNDTAYYVDPNSVSRLASLRVYSAFDTASSDVYANMRVMRNNATTDGMYIGYGNSGSTSALTRIFGGGATTGELSKYSNYTLEPGSFRSPIFYDSNNTSYYLDAASTSIINILTVSKINNFNGAITTWHTSSEGKARFYFADSASTYFGTGNNFVFRNTSDGGVLTIDGSGNLRTTTGGDNFASYSLHVGGTGFASTDFRAPIFYDSGNTAYYIDPASTSVLNAAQITTTYTNTIAKLTNGSPIVINSGLNGSLGLRVYYDMQLYNTLNFTDSSWNALGRIYGNSGNVTIQTTASTTSFVKYDGYSQEGGSFRAPLFYDSNDTTYYTDPASFSLISSMGIGGLTSSSNTGMYDSYVDGSSSYFQSPPLIIRKDSSATGAIDQAPVGLFIYNLNGTNNTWTKLSMGSREAAGAGNTVSIAGLAAQKTAGTANSWATGDLHFWTKSGATQITNMVAYSSGYVQSGYSFRAPIFYDSNDTTYYTDPSSLSNILELKTNKNWYDSSASAWGGGINMGGNNPSIGFQSTASTWWYMLHHSSSNINFYRRSTSGSWNHDGIWDSSGNLIWQGSSVRAPIFYDQNNTAYYLDAASTSNLVGLTVANTITGSITGNAGGSSASCTGNAATATILQTARNINGTSFNGSAAITTATWGTARTITIGSTGKSVDGSATVAWSLAEIGAVALAGSTMTGVLTTYTPAVQTAVTGVSAFNAGVNVGERAVTAGVASFIPAYGQTTVITSQGYRSHMILGSYRNSNANWAGGPFIAWGGNDANATEFWLFNQGGAITHSSGTTFLNTSSTLTAGNLSGTIPSAVLANSAHFIGTTSIALNRASASQTLTGVSIDGNSATTTLATKATRANGNFYIDDNYGNTVVGLYSPNRYQGVFTMGDAYKLTTDGTGVGNLYGIAWSHPNAGGAAGNLSDHGALILLNGGYAAAISSSIRCTADMRTPIYYDSNDTAYYLNPNGGSSLVDVTANEFYARNWFRNNDSGEGIYNQATTQHFYSDDVSYWNVASSSGVQGIRFRTGGHAGTVRGYVYANDSNDVGLLNNGGNWRIRVVAGDYTIFDGSSVRAQIFYDSNNTAYYIDGASTSNLNGLNIVDGNLELYKSQTVDMSNTTTYSTSNYYPVTISVPTEGCIIQIQNNLNSNVPSWATHGSGFTLNLRWRTNGSGWGTTEVRRYIEQYHERFANQTICGGITQMSNSSTEVVWLRGGGQYYFKFSRNLSATAQAVAYTINSQTVTPGSTAQNTIWNAYSGGWQLYNNQTISTDNMYTPVLYDYNNSAYYVDPASTSNLVGLTVANTITGSITGNAGGSSASCSGNAATATVLQTARTIGGVSFNGSANINLPGVNTAGNQNTTGTSSNITAYTINQNVGTANTPKFLNVYGERVAVTSASSTTVNTQYNVTELTMSASITTLTLSNIQASTIVHMWTIVTVGNGTTYSITWPAAIKWPGGTAPTITATNTKRDIYQFVTYDGGTTIYAIIVGQNL